jgi:hypothetical protein
MKMKITEANKWIKTSEQPPTVEGGPYLVIVRNPQDPTTYAYGMTHYKADEPWSDAIVYWLLLPVLPEEPKDEQNT